MKVSRQLDAVAAVILGKNVEQPLRWWLRAPTVRVTKLWKKESHALTRFRTAIRRSVNRYS